MNILQTIKDKPLLMGILNVTPDSFSDGGKYNHIDQAMSRVEKMIDEGVDIIDIGGESSGPDSKEVSLQEELERVMPVFEKIRTQFNIPLSVDTYKHQVALHALQVGVNMINDVTAFRGDEQMATVLADYDVPVVLMYSKDPNARTTRKNVEYDDVVSHINAFLKQRIAYAVEKGIAAERLIIDPGMGAFVSTKAKYSFEILKKLRDFEMHKSSILIGASRKSFLGGKPEDRLEKGLAAAGVALMNGANIIRTHD
ncbi:dihydropteroate synthase, partial [Candidatus Peregrinibacteria bacterium]|nr:dihydropteroate synthase [Candidatus Peregrinibacteria bacterium]